MSRTDSPPRARFVQRTRTSFAGGSLWQAGLFCFHLVVFRHCCTFPYTRQTLGSICFPELRVEESPWSSASEFCEQAAVEAGL